jgi:hypothetical protein
VYLTQGIVCHSKQFPRLNLFLIGRGSFVRHSAGKASRSFFNRLYPDPSLIKDLIQQKHEIHLGGYNLPADRKTFF